MYILPCVCILLQVFESVFMKLYHLKVIFSLVKDLTYALQKVLNLFIIFSIVLNELIFHFSKM